MTDLKDLLEQAAGTDPALTDADLAADLRRGKRSVRRRRFAGVAGGATAIAVVVAGAWAVLPGTGTSGLDVPAASATPPPASTTTATPQAGRTLPGREGLPVLPTQRPPVPAQPVRLVADGIVRPGVDLVCGLKPEGWKPVVMKLNNGMGSELYFTDPALDPAKYAPGSISLKVRHAGIYPDGTGRMLVEKYDKTWDELPHVQAGSRQAIVAGAAKGMRDVHMRMSKTKLIQVVDAAGLGWDLPTLLRFTGSCGYPK
ncbi:hypothetical protein [Kribbella catacumbae]|uniref:hypothetical protein n=1 Tax=Kribbella catacumbae TaxID=460086 RepID=UPI0003628D35|nr:hypothetical protein [Kribbella catacumbae]